MASKIASSSKVLVNSLPIPTFSRQLSRQALSGARSAAQDLPSSYHTPLRAPSGVSFRTSRRYASTSTSTSTSSPSISSPPPLPQHTGIRVIPPKLDLIKEEGFFDNDVKLVPEQEATIVLTPEAIRQLSLITSREPPDVLSKGKLALRVGVESGGCHGYQYTMDLTEERGVDDYVFQPEGIHSIPVVVDLVSLGLLKGSTLHYGTELIGSSFRLLNNPQAKEGGACGCGVSWEAKI